MTTLSRSLILLIAGALAVMLVGCSGGNGPTLPVPPDGGGSDTATTTVTPSLAGIEPGALPDTLTKGDFSVTIDGSAASVTKVERSAASGLVLCFIIDTTGSMSGTLNGVSSSIQAFADTFTGRDVYFSAVEYGDDIPGDSGTSRTAFTPSTDLTGFKTWVDGLEAYGGGDGPENHLDAMMYAKNHFSWPSGLARHFIILTDVTSHQKDDGSGYADYNVEDVLSAFKGWAIVHAVSPDLSSSWPSIDTVSVKGNDGVQTLVNIYDYYTDARELADGGPADKRTHSGTGGKWVEMPGSGSVDLTTLGITEAVTEAYTVTFKKPSSMTHGVLVIKADWTGGSATWDFGDTTF